MLVQFKNWKENGFSIIKGKDGQIYEGEFLDKMKHCNNDNNNIYRIPRNNPPKKF